MSFINKEEILKDYFVNPESFAQPSFTSRRNQLKSNLHEKESFHMLMSYTGVEVKYYTDDQLFDTFPDGLPDNIDGEVVLFFNVEDACRILGL